MPDTDTRLAKIEAKIDDMANTLAKIAVQDERIKHLETQVNAVWRKYDSFCSPGGELDKMQKHQSSCPRGQIRLIWYVLVPLGVSWLAAAYALMQMGHKLIG